MSISVVMIGATGAVGGHALEALIASNAIKQITILGRRPVEGITSPKVIQYTVDMEDASTYASRLPDHQAAICTLGVGEPSKISKADFVRIDKEMVLRFARACRKAEIVHFELLASVGASSSSPSFYLRTKGELEDELVALGFERLSLFHPSMILTPENRYGISQALTLAFWPKLHWLMQGKTKRYRGVEVDVLGKSMAHNLLHPSNVPTETLHWADFYELARVFQTSFT